MNLLVRVLGASVLGVIAGVIIIERDSHFIAVTRNYAIHFFNRTFACRATADLNRVHCFVPALQAEQLLVCDEQEQSDWHWSADALKVRSSWLTSWLKKTMPLSITARGITIYSRCTDGLVAIVPHLQKMFFETSTIAITLQRIALTDVKTTIHDPIHKHLLQLRGDVQVQCADAHMQTAITIRDGQLWYHDACIIASLTATSTVKHNATGTHWQLRGTALIPALHGTQQQQIIAYSEGETIVMRIADATHTIIMELIYDKSTDTVQMQGTVPWALLQQCVPQTRTIENNNAVAINATIKRVSTQPSIHATVAHDAWGSYAIDQAEQDGQKIITVTPVALPRSLNTLFTLSPQTKLVMRVSKGIVTTAQLHAPCLYKKKISLPIAIRATRTAQQTYTLAGRVGAYQLNAALDAQGLLKQGTVLHNKKSIANITYNAQNDTYHTQSALQSLGIRGVGTVHATYTRAQPRQIRVSMANAHVPIPGIYNIVRSFDGTVTLNVAAGTVAIHVPTISCHQGTIGVDATVHLHEHDTWVRGIAWGKQVLVNYKKDFFGALSGTVVGQYRSRNASVIGSIVVDEGQYNKNIFAGFFARDHGLRYPSVRTLVHAVPCTLESTVRTRETVHVDTSFLEGDIHAQLQMSGTVQEPQLEGAIHLAQGTLKFPACPLNLTYGSVILKSTELHNPHIAFEAKGLFKKYSLLLRTQGTVQNPTILFESTPPLTQEQIITLLLAGSEDGSLLLMMPTLIMHQMQQLLFGPEQTPSRLDSFFKGLLSPLKRMRFVPSFFDQTGRGGFRGKIDVDVSDRLKASLQKNFSLTEDSTIEVEYAISDDTSVRALKDERGDVGGEIEMRFKF